MPPARAGITIDLPTAVRCASRLPTAVRCASRLPTAVRCASRLPTSSAAAAGGRRLVTAPRSG